MLASLLALLLVAGTAQAGDTTPRVRNRVSVGVIAEAAQTTGEPALEVYLSESLRAELVRRDRLKVDLYAAGRLGIRALDGGRLDRARIRALALTIRTGTWTLDLGRFAPLGGNFRLVDGLQALAEVVPNLQVGAWAGASPDPYTTLPAPRFGGGPIIAWRTQGAEVSLLGEVLATPAGLDRAGGILRGRFELGRLVEVAGHVDLQAGGAATPVRLADALVIARIDPKDDLRLTVLYDAWSGLSYLVSTLRDPWITRFDQRAQALADETFVPQDMPDPTVSHLVSAQGMWRPAVGPDGAWRFILDAGARYRHHAIADRRFARGHLGGTLQGLAVGRLDVSLMGVVLHWGGTPGAEARAGLWAQLDKSGRLSLDTSATLAFKPLNPGAPWRTTLYADAFVDWVAGKGITLSLGYALTSSSIGGGWDAYHAVLGRVGWSFDTARVERPRPEVLP